MGVSQGAGLATLVAGIDNRVKLLAMSNPVLSQNGGLSFNRAGGFPNYVQQSNFEVGTSSHENATVSATRYYDAMFAARKFNGPALAILSYEDLVTPAATGFATFNQLNGPKILCHGTELGHAHPPQYWTGRIDFLKRNFPSTQNTAPFPFGSNNLGYFVDAGQNTSTSGNSINLSANIADNNSNNPNFQLNWKKISGPGNVSFGSSNSYNTNATFSSSGTYILEFSGTDNSLLNSEDKFFTLSDRITVNVGSGGGGGSSGGNNDNTPPSVSLNTSSTNVSSSFTVNINFSESINGLSQSDFSVSNGSVSNLNGSGSFYQVTVNPFSSGQVTISLPASRVTDPAGNPNTCLLYTSPSPRDATLSRMPSSA